MVDRERQGGLSPHGRSGFRADQDEVAGVRRPKLDGPGANAITLRARLIGTWHLVSYEAKQPGGATIFPMGKELDGRITYTEDGDVSVHIAARGRPNLASGDISEGTTEEWAAAARGYFGYCGTFEVDEERGSVTHIVALSLVPNWTGQRQVRHVNLTGDGLELSGVPTLIAGTTRTAHLLWRRHLSRACRATAR